MDIESIKKEIEHIRRPCVEIAGPTPDGFEFLIDNSILLATKPTVTNTQNETVLYPFGDDPQRFIVDEVVDVRNLPYANRSIGVILTSCLPVVDRNITKQKFDETLKQKVKDEYKSAIALNGDAVNYGLHLHLYREAGRTLVNGGYLIQVEPFDSYEAAAARFGLRLVYEYEREQKTAVFRK